MTMRRLTAIAASTLVPLIVVAFMVDRAAAQNPPDRISSAFGPMPEPGKQRAAATATADGGLTPQETSETDWWGTSNAMLFRDDEFTTGYLYLNTYQKSREELTLWYPPNDDLTSFDLSTGNSTMLAATERPADTPAWGARNLARGNGRIHDPNHDAIAIAWYTNDGSVRVETRSTDWPNITLLHGKHITGTLATQRSVAVAVGDLDKVVGEDNYYHDEVVVARTANTLGNAHNVQVDILDYNWNTIITASFAGPRGTAATSGATSVAATVGDFNSDHAYELAVAAYWFESLTWQVNLYRLDQDETTKAYTLTQIGTLSTKIPANASGATTNPLDIAAGDFANTGKDQIALVMGTTDVSSSVAGRIYVLELDSANGLQLKSWDYFNHYGTNPVWSLRVAAGIFRYDPTNGYDLNRRDLMVFWDETSLTSATSTRLLRYYKVGTDYHPFSSQLLPYRVPTYGSDTDSGYLSKDLDLAVGNFVGHGINKDQTSPTMQIGVIFTWLTGNASPINLQMRVYKVSPESLQTFTQTWFTIENLNGEAAIPYVMATDYDGDSWLLGNPTIFTFNQFPKLTSIIQEPPKHVDYLPVDYRNPLGAWDVVSIGARTDFKVSMTDKDGYELNTTTSSKSSWEVGGGGSADFSLCLGWARHCADDPAISVDVKLGLSGKYEYQEETINTKLSKVDFSYSIETATDDAIYGKYQTVNLWRYPVIGYQTSPPESLLTFWEVVIPGLTTKFLGGGFDHSDFYQPLHENHNVLSYPALHLTGGMSSWVPPDLGSFTIPDPAHPSDPEATKTVTAVMNWPNNEMLLTYWDGNPIDIDLQFSQESGTSTEKTHQSTMTESLDAAVGVHGTIRLAGKRIGNVGGDFAANFDSQQTWGGGSIGETKQSSAKGIIIEKPAGENADKAYAFTSAVYVSTDGALKVAHATDPKGSTQGAEWWQGQYGRKPDPALNLPYRFEYHKPYGAHLEEWWTLRPLDDSQRKRMRGFFMRFNTPDENTGKNELVPWAPTDGEIVQLCARVYNYSFRDTPPFQARFYYQQWDTQNAVPLADPETQPNMAVDVPMLSSVLKPGGIPMREVCVPWDTTGLSLLAPAYRFVVRLDEEQWVDELHESWDASGTEIAGGNNEGFWPWFDGVPVLATAATGPNTATAQAGIYFPKHQAIAVKTEDGIRPGEGVIRVTQGQTYPVRVHFISDATDRSGRAFLLFDGDPKKGGKALASRTIYGVRAGDNYRWGEWTPKVLGMHEVWVHVLQPPGIPDSDQAWTSVKVNVVAKKTK